VEIRVIVEDLDLSVRRLRADDDVLFHRACGRPASDAPTLRHANGKRKRDERQEDEVVERIPAADPFVSLYDSPP